MSRSVVVLAPKTVSQSVSPSEITETQILNGNASTVRPKPRTPTKIQPTSGKRSPISGLSPCAKNFASCKESVVDEDDFLLDPSLEAILLEIEKKTAKPKNPENFKIGKFESPKPDDCGETAATNSPNANPKRPEAILDKSLEQLIMNSNFSQIVHPVHKNMDAKVEETDAGKRPKSECVLNDSLQELLLNTEFPQNLPVSTEKPVLNDEPVSAVESSEMLSENLNDSSQDLFGDDFNSTEPAEAVEPIKDCPPSELKPRSFTVKTWEVCSNDTRVLCDDNTTVVLRGFWRDTPLISELPIRVFGTWVDGQTEIVVSDTENYLVINPDVLVMCTTVASGVYCRRKTVLSDRFRGLDPPNQAMLVGTLVHELFQSALALSEPPVDSWFEDQLKVALTNRSIFDQLYGMEMRPERLRQEIQLYYGQMRQWIRKYVFDKTDFPLSEGMKFDKVRDIEENIWCPKFGIRGKVDVSLEVRRNDRRRVVPLELKTGKSSKGADHQGQVLLYTLMLSSLTDCNETVQEGMLLYLKDGAQHRVQSNHSPIRGLLQLRNELAFYLGQKNFESLPAPINDSRFCPKCPQLINCAAWQRTFELEKSFPGENSTMKDLVPKSLEHLSQEHLNYFTKWVRWIFLEWESAKKQKSNVTDIWNKSAAERQRKGNALADMRLDSMQESCGAFLLIFKKSSGGAIPFGMFNVGETIVGSSESRKHVAVFMGSIRKITDEELMVVVDKEMRDELRSDTFRLDRYESFATFQINLSNVSRLMEDTETSARLRSLIIGQKTPEFALKLPGSSTKKLKPVITSLNAIQVKAVVRALMAKDYVLVKGLPGSGKTSTIVTMIKALLALEKSVLVTAYTHSAVDNILKKLMKEPLVSESQMVRLGSKSQVNSECWKLSPDAKLKDTCTLEAVKNLYDKTPIVACTCLQAANHVLFAKGRKFDYVIVDEATLALQSSCVGALLNGEKFILVGDPKQLSPLVVSNQAKSEGMDRDLFSELESLGSGKALVTLNLQYRMNEVISKFSSTLLYNGELECADELIAKATVALTDTENIPDTSWMSKCLSSSLEHSLLFLNTAKDELMRATNFGPGLMGNKGEVKLVVELCEAFSKAGVAASDLGVICVYRYQKKLVFDALPERLSDVEVNTVDQYQGKDKSVILVSFVWTPNLEKRSELLKDSKRINVALTRAKHKLILIGHLTGLKQYELLEKFAGLLTRDQIVNMD